MGKINLGRVFLGGMAAGAFSWAVQYLCVLLGLTRGLGDMLGLPLLGDPSTARIITVGVAEVFVGGPLAIWFYAAIRPRFGAGAKTAVITAVWIWFTLGPYEQTVVTAVGFVAPLPFWAMVQMNIASLPVIVASVLIGAWIYKEEEAPAAATAAG